MPGVLAAEAAAGVTAAAKGAFNYNRANYFFDAGMRFGRFNTGYGMAIAQTSQYREDIRDLTECTVTKADTYHTVGTICFVLNFQLIMAGRLGVHGPSPPGWLLGMYWTNICSALMFLVTFTWMAMHSGARATAGGAYMLTRSVRLPIPSPKMLDEARMLGNEFEKQRVIDMFRIPFVAPAPKETQEDPESGAKVTVSGRRMPRWYRDEVAELRAGEGNGSSTANPEHFELYRGLQEEWWGYDIYARIGILFFFSNWLASASLYSMCHVFTELRCVWPAYTVVGCFVTAHYGILSLDIVAPKKGGIMPIPMEKIVPFVPCIAVVGMTIDYSILTPSMWWQNFIYFLSICGYLIYFCWALRMLDLATPRYEEERPEVAGQAWSPCEWPLPPAFRNAVYLITAPKHLEPGQTCLLNEMRAAAANGSTLVKGAPKKQKQAQPAMLPWKLFRGACITCIAMWTLIMFGRGFEMVNGERFLLKQEGRVERWPSHMQPWMSPWTREGKRDMMCHAGGCDRRLGASDDLAAAAKGLIATLAPLAQALDGADHSAEAKAPKLASAKVAWPAGFRPSLLTAHADGSQVLALDHATARGALLNVNGRSAGAAEVTLKGVVGEILGAAWDAAGLVLTMANGALIECEGKPLSGAWSCQASKAPALPGALASAVVSRDASGAWKAAVVFKGDDSITLLDGHADLDEWLPAGEVHVPGAKPRGAAPRLSMAGAAQELIISTADGSVHRRGIAAGRPTKAAPAAPAAAGKTWYTACGLAGGRVAHLASRHGAAPELFVSA